MTATTKTRDEVRYELVAEPVSDMRVTDPIQIVRRALRGRYAMAGLLAIVCASAGACVGYLSTQPTYESTGLIRIAPTLPSVLSEEQHALTSGEYADYVARQVAHLTSREVLETAVNSTHLAKHGWASGINGVTELESAMNIARTKGEPFIGVVVTHQHPVIARDAANAILDAYTRTEENFVSEVDEASIVALLQEREATLQNQLLEIRRQMLDSTDQYGAEANEKLHNSKVEELVAIDQKLAELGIAISSFERDGKTNGLIAAPNDTEVNNDPVLANLRQEEQTVLGEIGSWSENYGPAHPIIRELNRRLDAIRIRIDLREGTAVASAQRGKKPTPADLTGTSLERLLDMEVAYQTMRETVRQEAAVLGQRRLAVQSMVEHATEIKERLVATRGRLDAIIAEQSINSGERAAIASYAETPLAPTRDRRQGLASAGAVLGGMVGVGLMVLFGIVDRRCRFVADLLENLPDVPILAVVPELTERDAGSNAESVIAVHQLRNLMRTQSHHTSKNIFSITSTNGGEGKTSLTLALGASFAGAGNSTLIIDADPVHCALSKELNLNNLPGLCQAIGPDSSSAEVHRTRTENLWVLPVGSSSGFDPQRLSYEKLSWLLDAVRDRFEIILIDTGSVMNAPEAPLVAACADEAVMLINRNQSMPHIDAAIRRLEQNGASLAGVVFNRVAPSDLTSAQRSISRSAPTSGAVELIPNAIPQAGFPINQFQHSPFINNPMTGQAQPGMTHGQLDATKDAA